MNIPQFKTPAYTGLRLLIGPALFILFIISFFLFYNSFLVDHSIESLKFSLLNVALAETVAEASRVAPLVQLQFVNELASPVLTTENLINLGYSSDVLETSHPERDVKDAAAVMEEVIRVKESKRNPILQFFDKLNDSIKRSFRKISALRKKEELAPDIDLAVLVEINEYENKGEFERAIKLYKEAIAKFPNYAQTPTLILRLGYLLHKLGRFKEAEDLYKEIIRRFSDSTEARVVKELMDILKKRPRVSKKADEIISKIAKTEYKKAKQRLYYEHGLIELSALNLENAKKSFTKAVSILPDTNIADECSLRIGVCERLLGELDASLEVFKKLADITVSPELKIHSKYQIAQTYRQKGNYGESASSLENILKEHRDKRVEPLLLFQLGSTYLYDVSDASKAKEVFEELRIHFPGNRLVYPGTYFVDEHIELDVLPKMPEELERLLKKTWVEAVLPEETQRIIDAAMVKFMTHITKTAKEIILRKKRDHPEAGNYVTIELTQMKLNEYIKRWFPPGSEKAQWDLSVEYKSDQRMKIYGTFNRSGKKRIEGFIIGKFKMVSIVDLPYWADGRKHRNFVLFTAEECKISGIPVPPAIMNIVLRQSVENFNKYFPLDIKEFRLTEQTIFFAGVVREDILRGGISE